MKLPEKIEVLNRTYRVIEKDLSEGNTIGHGKFTQGIVCIDSGLDAQLRADTMLHEIIHLILIAMGHNYSEEEGGLHTEKNILVISNGLSCFLRDNGDMFKDLIDALD